MKHTQLPPDLLSEFSALFRTFGMGKDGFEAGTSILAPLVAKLQNYEDEYLYPWYCLLAALASDYRRHVLGEPSAFEWEVTRRLSEALERATYVQYLLERNGMSVPLSPEVTAFLQRAKIVFAGRCRQIIISADVREAERDVAMAELFDVISVNDKNRQDCMSVLLDLEALSAVGSREWADVLGGIYRTELGSDVRL